MQEMQLNRIVWMSVVLVTVLAVVSPGYAQTSPQQISLIRKLYKSGKRLAIRRRFSRAIDKYIQALMVIRRAERQAPATKRQEWKQRRLTMLYIIGRTYHFNRQYPEALRYYRRCLASGPRPRVEKQVKRFLAEVLPKVQVILYLKTTPARSRVTVTTVSGEQRSGLSPFLTQIEPGKIRIRITHKGYRPQVHWLQVRASTRVERLFRLEKEIKLPSLPLRTSPRKMAGASTRTVMKRPPVIRRNAGPPLRQVGLWSGVGVGAVGIVAGSVLVGMAASDFQQANSMKGNANFKTADVVALADSGNFKQTMGFVALGVGLLGGGVAAYFAFQKPAPVATSQAKLSSSSKTRQLYLSK